MKIKQRDLLSLGVLVGSVLCINIISEKFTIPRCPTQVPPVPQEIPVIKAVDEDNWEDQVEQKAGSQISQGSPMFPDPEDESQGCIFEDCQGS